MALAAKSCRRRLPLVQKLQTALGGFTIEVEERLDCGAAYYKDSGNDCSTAAFEAARNADAILLGAMGLPSVRLPDGTEIAPHLRMRDEFGLYAGVRPVKAFPNTPRRLLDERAAKIDLIVLRESTEGLFYSHGRGEVIGDSEARETLRITRPTTENLCDTALQARRAGARPKAARAVSPASTRPTCSAPSRSSARSSTSARRKFPDIRPITTTSTPWRSI